MLIVPPFLGNTPSLSNQRYGYGAKHSLVLTVLGGDGLVRPPFLPWKCPRFEGMPVGIPRWQSQGTLFPAVEHSTHARSRTLLSCLVPK